MTSVFLNLWYITGLDNYITEQKSNNKTDLSMSNTHQEVPNIYQPRRPFPNLLIALLGLRFYPRYVEIWSSLNNSKANVSASLLSIPPTQPSQNFGTKGKKQPLMWPYEPPINWKIKIVTSRFYVCSLFYVVISSIEIPLSINQAVMIPKGPWYRIVAHVSWLKCHLCC